MSQNRITKLVRNSQPPWPPLSVSLCALLFPTFPAGAAILTICNLERLGQIDRPTSRRLMAISVAVFAVGFRFLTFIASRRNHGVPTVDSSVGFVMSVGVCAASYLVQRLPFRAWRVAHVGARTSPILVAIGMSVVYELIAILVAVPVLSLAVVFSTSGVTSLLR